MKKILSILKLFLIAVYHIFFPYYFLFPKFAKVVFVITTGRSGSASLSSVFKDTDNVRALHEPYPIMNNSFYTKERFSVVWNKLIFYLVKYPIILKSCKKENDIYLETNHQFIKNFAVYAVNVFGKKMGIIHLRREPWKVAKSMFEINKIPGEGFGNKWYLDTELDSNILNYERISNHLNINPDSEYVNYLKCVWYYYEIEARAEKFISEYPGIDILDIDTSELNNLNVLKEKCSSFFGLNPSVLSSENESNDIEKNKKKEEKVKFIEDEVAKNLQIKFHKALIYEYR